jgi:hypothetical protein
MRGFLKKLFHKTEPQKTTLIKLDADEICRSVNAAMERTKRILRNKPCDLPAGAIKTINLRKESILKFKISNVLFDGYNR